MMGKVFLRTPYNYDTDAVSNETGLRCEDESLAQQHEKEDSDINTIVRRFGLTGELPSNVRVPQYGDFTSITDFQSALDTVKDAQAAFMAMPADVRSRFQNNSQLFVEFCSDPANIAEMRKMGLVVPASAPEPVPPVPQGGSGSGATPPVDTDKKA